jgi:hypothetical protein
VPDTPLSEARIVRFSVVTGPTGIMGMVANFFPPHFERWVHRSIRN